MVSLAISFLLCLLTVCDVLFISGETAHWFLLPVLFCGVLIGCDAVDWLRGRLNLFDPAGLIGALGVHFFFLAPLLHVTWNSWMKYIDPPPDWRDWLGRMAILNAVGLVLYRCARTRVAMWRQDTTKEVFWQPSRKRLLTTVGWGLALSGALQVWVYARFGGIGGYIATFSQATFSQAVDDPGASSGFQGMGWIFMLSESFPILAMIYFAVRFDRSAKARTWPIISLVLFGFLALQMLFGGLRGSRSNTIWALFWAAGIIHLWIRPLNRTFVFAGVGFLVVFMYLYGFYKDLGQNTWDSLKAGTILADTSRKNGRTLDAMLLGDLGRADVQAFLLYRLSMPNRDYQYVWGSTYIEGAAVMIPRALWPNRPPGKVKAGTEAQYGVGSWDPDTWSSSLVYGLAGEGMLNFGPLAVPLAYGVFGLIVGMLQRFCYALRQGDTRLLLCPFVITTCFSIIASDSDNLVFNTIKGGFLPALVVWFGSRVLVDSRTVEPGSRKSMVLPEPGIRTG